MSEESGRFGPSIDLATEADFHLGGLLVSPSTREVSRGGTREMLEPRVLQVLVALSQGKGRVISRDELIARCWEGRIVGEDAINRAIGRLRRLSETSSEAPFVIETIPRVGYRLSTQDLSGAATQRSLAVTPLLQSASSPTQSIPPVDSQLTSAPFPAVSRRRGVFLIAGPAIVLFAALAAALLLWPTRHWAVESSRPFISSLALEGEPAFSPDGKTLAYSAGPDLVSRKIYVRNLAGGDPTRVTNDSYDDVSPTWSADGTHIAYVGVKPGEPCRIMVVSVPAGEARQVGRCAEMQTSSVSWQPGTSFLYYMDHVTPGDPAARESVSEYLLRFTDIIMRLDLDSGARVKLPKEPSNTILSMMRVECSPDGKSLLFVGAESASTAALRIRDLASGKERLLGKIVIGGSAAWAEDSRSVLIAKASGIGSDITVHPIDGTSPYSLYAAAINVSHLATGKGGLLALETDPRRQNLARASARPASQPDIMDAANGKSWSPSFSPDGTLAFLSNRSGTNAVWVMKPGAAPAPLYDGGAALLFRLAYSPDGKYLAMAVARDDGLTITILTAEGATLSSFTSPTFGFGSPTWTEDSKEVVYFDRRALAYVRVNVANPSHRRLAAPKLWGAVFYHGGHTYAAKPFLPGYWRLDKQPKLLTAKYPLSWAPPPALFGDELLVPDFTAPDGARILAQPLTGGADRVLGYAPGAQAQQEILESGMAVNPQTHEVIYVASVQSDTNIDLLTQTRH